MSLALEKLAWHFKIDGRGTPKSFAKFYGACTLTPPPCGRDGSSRAYQREYHFEEALRDGERLIVVCVASR